MKLQFLRGVLPSMLAFLFSGIYAIVDGFFVGQNVGDNGLAAINIAYPLVALLQAAGTGIGMGGAVRISMAIGRGDEEEQQGFFRSTLLLLAGVSVLLTGFLLLASPFLLRVFGAEGVILEYAEEYLLIIGIGSAFQIFSTGLVPLIRNYDGAFSAMLSMIAGFCTNVFLDWLFVSVLPWGIGGAALATVIGQIVTLAFCIFFLFHMDLWKHVKLGRASLQRMCIILVVGISPFGLTLSPNFILLIVNRAAASFGGARAVACFAVVSYAVCVVQLLLQGIGDGCQPLLSRYYGMGEHKTVLALRRLAYLFALLTGVACVILLFLCRKGVPVLFGASEQAVSDVMFALPIFLPGLLFVSFLRITISYFYAVGHNQCAYLLIYGEPASLLVLTLILPHVLGVTGIWICVPLAQCLMAVLGCLLLKRTKMPVISSEESGGQ